MDDEIDNQDFINQEFIDQDFIDTSYIIDFDRCCSFNTYVPIKKEDKPLTTSENYNKYVPVSFGMPNKNITWKLGNFLPHEIIHRLILLPEQIEAMYDLVDWDIISTYNLTGDFLLRYKHLINWKIYIKNDHIKSINDLVLVKDKIIENKHIFMDIRIKRKYYTIPFVKEFSSIIDWKWLCKNVKLNEDILLTFWNKFKHNSISKYQQITTNIAKKKLASVNWIIASKRKLSENTISLARNYVSWELICRYQKLSAKFLNAFVTYLHWANTSMYQVLPDDFIVRYHKKLNMSLVCIYQKLSISTIKELEHVLKFDLLYKNKYYNQPGEIQIATNGKQYFVIEPPPMGNVPMVSYYSAEGAEF